MEKIIKLKFRRNELRKQAEETLKKAGKNKPSNEEIEDQMKTIVQEKFLEVAEEVEKGSNLEISILNNLFVDEELRKKEIKDLSKLFESEKKKWIRETCGWDLTKEVLKGKTFSEKLLILFTIPFDWYTINRYFNLLKNFSKRVLEICDVDLPQEKSEILLNRLKKETEELKFLDQVFVDYCNLDFSYYQKTKEFLMKRVLVEDDDEPEIDEIVKKIKEII